MISAVSDWLTSKSLIDLVSFASSIVSILGFPITLWNVVRSKKAAEAAQAAANDAKESIRLFDTVADFTAAISLLEDIKRAHRQEQWVLLPDRYAGLRKLLVALRSSTIDLDDTQKAVIQGAIVDLQSMEQAVERALPSSPALKPAKMNKLLSNHIDQLVEVLAELKKAKVGV